MLKYWYIRYPNIKLLLRERVRSSQKVLGVHLRVGCAFYFYNKLRQGAAKGVLKCKQE